MDLTILPTSLPTSLGLPTQSGVGGSTLQPGQIIEAVVLAVLENNSLQLALPDATLVIQSAVPLAVGDQIQLAVKSTGSGVELALVPQAGIPAAGPEVDVAQAVSSQAASEASRTVPNRAGVTAAPTAAPDAWPPAVEISIQGAGSPASIVPRPVMPAAAAPDAALISAVRVAAARQGGLAPLFADVEQLVGGSLASVPASVVRAAAQLLALRLPLAGNLAASDVQQALSQSGLFLEARLAPPSEGSSAAPNPASPSPGAGVGPNANRSSLPGSSPPPSQAAEPPSPATDLKAAMLVFRQAVRMWSDQTAGAAAPGPSLPANPGPGASAAPPPPPLEPSTLPDVQALLSPLELLALPGAQALASPGNRADPEAQPESSLPPVPPQSGPPPPPPYRGSPPAAQPAVAASLSGNAAPGEMAQRLLRETDAALARHTLLQVASLPDRVSGDPARPQTQGPQWMFEVPLLNAAGTSVAQFEIGRDGRATTADGRTIWRARFSVDIEPIGPVHAQVALLGDRAAVTLWAEREQSATRLRDSAPLLANALKQADLQPGDIQCRSGSPPAPRAAGPAAGRFLDRAS